MHSYVYTCTHLHCVKSFLLQCDQDSSKTKLVLLFQQVKEHLLYIKKKKYPQSINKITSIEMHCFKPHFRMSVSNKQLCAFQTGHMLCYIFLFLSQPWHSISFYPCSGWKVRLDSSFSPYLSCIPMRYHTPGMQPGTGSSPLCCFSLTVQHCGKFSMKRQLLTYLLFLKLWVQLH